MQRIQESEFILNKRGAVYHLDLRPEELAPTIITVGDPDRVMAVSKHFDKIEFQCQHREFVSHTGYLGNKRLTVISTGIGPGRSSRHMSWSLWVVEEYSSVRNSVSPGPGRWCRARRTSGTTPRTAAR